jgi:hypothetical protein
MCTGSFNPQGSDYDYSSARAAGMGPDGTGENAGHWGSVAAAPEYVRQKYGLPEDSYLMLKGRNHPTWDKGVAGEVDRGYKIIEIDNRYYSVPRSLNIPID